MTLEVVHREGSFRLSRVRERVPIPRDLFCLWKSELRVKHVTITVMKFVN
jgi:hypothetical protein